MMSTAFILSGVMLEAPASSRPCAGFGGRGEREDEQSEWGEREGGREGGRTEGVGREGGREGGRTNRGRGERGREDEQREWGEREGGRDRQREEGNFSYSSWLHPVTYERKRAVLYLFNSLE